MEKSVGNLSLNEKVGQMFMIGLDGFTADETIMELIQTHKIGGVVLYENNVQSAEQLLRLINSIKAMNVGNQVPLFIATAHEGGRQNVIPNEIRKMPAIKYIAEDADKSLVYDAAHLNARILKAFGFNMNFWPVLDLGGSVDGRNLGDRCISANPVVTSSYSAQMISALNDVGIIPVPKYFPGHGTTKDKGSNLIIPSTSKSIYKLEQADLVPFKAAIEAGIDGLMVGHINLSKLNLFAPATMSYKVVTKLLQEKYEYKGVIISDDLCAPCVDIQYGIKSSVRKAIMAGCELMIIRDVKKVKSVLEDITRQIKKGNLDPKVIDLRVQKILDLKAKFNIKDEEISEIEIKKLNDEVEEIIEKVRK